MGQNRSPSEIAVVAVVEGDNLSLLWLTEQATARSTTAVVKAKRADNDAAALASGAAFCVVQEETLRKCRGNCCHRSCH